MKIYYIHSGYTAASDAYQDLYYNKNLRPSVELMNNMVDDAKTVMTKYMSLEELIHKHTMFPEYGRFIDHTKRERLIKEADFTRGNWINNVMIPTLSSERYLKYCPLCVKEDRVTYGETYWHRMHQIIGIKICAKHRVYLQDSEVVINRNLTRLKAAEIIIPRKTVITGCEDKNIILLADYMERIFDSQKYSHEHIGRYLNRHIASKYIQNRLVNQRIRDVLCREDIGVFLPESIQVDALTPEENQVVGDQCYEELETCDTVIWVSPYGESVTAEIGFTIALKKKGKPIRIVLFGKQPKSEAMTTPYIDAVVDSQEQRREDDFSDLLNVVRGEQYE